MFIVLNEASPVISFDGCEYVVRLAAVRLLKALEERELFAVVAFDLVGTNHVEISNLFLTREEARRALDCGFESKANGGVAKGIVDALLARGAARIIA